MTTTTTNKEYRVTFLDAYKEETSILLGAKNSTDAKRKFLKLINVTHETFLEIISAKLTGIAKSN